MTKTSLAFILLLMLLTSQQQQQFITTCTGLAIPLNPIEKVLFQTRLDSIQTKVQQSSYLQSSSSSSFIQNEIKNLVIIFPGAGGPDQFTEELESIIRSKTSNNNNYEDASSTRTSSSTNTCVTTLDWSDYRGSLLTAAFDGEAVGEALAQKLWNTGLCIIQQEEEEDAKDNNGQINKNISTILHGKDLELVHCIGISVGAFPSNKFATSIHQFREEDFINNKNNNNNNDSGGGGKSPYIRLTLLDPFCSRGVWGGGYGSSNFGLNVDYAEQYLNTDDPVPTTNDPLPLCACVDVTGAKERESFVLPEGESMHCWPLVYFARYGYEKFHSEDSGMLPRLIHGVDGILKRGSIERR